MKFGRFITTFSSSLLPYLITIVMKPSVYAALQKADEVKTLPALIALGGAPQKPPSQDASTKSKFGRGGKVKFTNRRVTNINLTLTN